MSRCVCTRFFGTWHRDADHDDMRDIIVVSHGVAIRSIVMRWLHLIEDGEDKGYIFEGFPKPQL